LLIVSCFEKNNNKQIYFDSLLDLIFDPEDGGIMLLRIIDQLVSVASPGIAGVATTLTLVFEGVVGLPVRISIVTPTILIEVFRGFLQPHPLPSISFPIRHSTIILLFNARKRSKVKVKLSPFHEDL
jgi:hypothetical protein